nr:maleidride-like protein [Wicklowia aquatica]
MVLTNSQFMHFEQRQEQMPPSLRLTPSQNADSVLHEVVASRRCSCSYTAFQATMELQRQSRIDFESILCVGARIFDQWADIIGCKHCRTNPQSLVVLTTAAERMLILYTAACETYGLAGGMEEDTETVGSGLNARFRGSLPPAVGVDSPHTSTEQVVCVHSPMKLGQLVLEGEGAKLLARVLLSRSLVKFGALLEDQNILALYGPDMTNQNSVLGACGASIAETMEKLMILAGLIRT